MMREGQQYAYLYTPTPVKEQKSWRLALYLLVSLFMVGFSQQRVLSQGRTESFIYNGDNGDFGQVIVEMNCHFEGTKMVYTVFQVNVAISYKMRDNEPELFKEVTTQHLLTTKSFLSSLETDFSAVVAFGLTKLSHSSAPISGKIYGVGKRQYAYFEGPAGADQIVRDYYKEHQSNLYTDNASLAVGRRGLSGLHIYELERAIDALRDKLKSDKRETQRQFDSKITQATLQANLSKFEEARALLQEAYGLIKGNRERQSKYDQTKRIIEQRKQATQQKNRAQEDKAAQERALAEKKEQELAADQKKVAAAKQAQQQATLKKQQQGQKQGQVQKQARSADPSTSGGQMTAYDRARQAAQLKREKQQQAAAELAEQKRIAQEKKAEETRQRIQQMKAQMEETRRKAERLDAAADESIEGMVSAGNDPIGTLNAAKPLAMEFAKQGSAAGAYGTIGLAAGVGAWKMLSANKKRKDAERAAAQQREKIRQQQEAARKKREAEQQRLRAEAFALLIQERHTILSTFNQSDQIPLSTTAVSADTIYYFLYAIDSSTFEKAKTTVYLSNVFAIERYHDGTWPYQSRIVREIAPLTPHREILQGYYLKQSEAEDMRAEFVSGFSQSDGVDIREVAYRTESLGLATGEGAGTDGNRNPGNRDPGAGLGSGARSGSGLGIPLGPIPEKHASDRSEGAASGRNQKAADTKKKAGTGKSGGLGIPIQ